MQGEVGRVRDLYEGVAGHYDRFIKIPETLLFQGGRQWVCSCASGEVLEVALGTGRNLPYYPRGVRLTGIELSPAMLEVARRRAGELGIEADLREGDAHNLPFADESFDTLVFALSLCTIPDDRRAIAEAGRVLRPGGRVVLLEHVGSTVPAVRAAQRLLDPLTVRFQADHLLREPMDNLRREGFDVEILERSKWSIVERAAARKPTREERGDDAE